MAGRDKNMDGRATRVRTRFRDPGAQSTSNRLPLRLRRQPDRPALLLLRLRPPPAPRLRLVPAHADHRMVLLALGRVREEPSSPPRCWVLCAADKLSILCIGDRILADPVGGQPDPVYRGFVSIRFFIEVASLPVRLLLTHPEFAGRDAYQFGSVFRIDDHVRIGHGGGSLDLHVHGEDDVPILPGAPHRGVVADAQDDRTKRLAAGEIFAESAVAGNGSDWNLIELGLLGDISVAMEAIVIRPAKSRSSIASP